MLISHIGTSPGMQVDAANMAGGIRAADALRQFDALLYRTLLPSSRSAPGIGGANKVDGVIFAGMINDFLAQEIARHQSGFGAMLLRTIEEQQGSQS